MKKVIAIVLLALLITTAVAAGQNYANTPERGCTRYDASAKYWGYDCNGKAGFYQSKTDAEIQTEVYNYCNASRQVIDGDREQHCGDMQDATNSEFLCDQRNFSPTTHCWVEVK